MGKAMQDIYFAILSEASRRRRLTEYKINNPTGLIDGCSPYGAKAGKTVDDLDHPDARTIDETTTAEPFRTKSRLCRACGNPVPHTADGATCCYDCEQDLRARAAAAHRSPRTRRVALIEHFPAEHKNTSTDHNDAKCPSPLAYPTTSDINALVTWALRNDLVRDNQSDRLAKQLLGAYRASHTFRQTPDGAPSHI